MVGIHAVSVVKSVPITLEIRTKYIVETVAESVVKSGPITLAMASASAHGTFDI